MKTISKKFFASLVLALFMSVFVLELPANAAANSVETRYIIGDGVRLRKEGWTGGTVLELMYNGETIRFFPDIYGSDPEYNYMQRVETGTYGYVDHHYTRL